MPRPHRATARVALATARAYAALPDDDRLVLAPLAALGVRAEPAVWDDPDVRWAEYDAVVIRSCWDYHLRHDDFAAWVDALAARGVPLWNPPAVVRWNANKAYLRDLAAAGVPTMPTRWANASTPYSLGALLAAEGWDEAVVKPAVSASAFRTWRVRAGEADAREAAFREALAAGPLLVQPFARAVVEAGEWSLVVLGGAYSHAALKRPRAGDFRVQAEHGGSAAAAEPPPHAVAEALDVVRAFAPGCLYARVDGVVDGGRLVVMELELVEPSLFLGLAPGAAERFAKVIAGAVR